MDKNLVLTFAYIAIIFMIMAFVNITAHTLRMETIPMSYRIPTAKFQVVIRNCCGHGICIKERHHEEIQWQYLAAKN